MCGGLIERQAAEQYSYPLLETLSGISSGGLRNWGWRRWRSTLDRRVGGLRRGLWIMKSGSSIGTRWTAISLEVSNLVWGFRNHLRWPVVGRGIVWCRGLWTCGWWRMEGCLVFGWFCGGTAAGCVTALVFARWLSSHLDWVDYHLGLGWTQFTFMFIYLLQIMAFCHR